MKLSNTTWIALLCCLLALPGFGQNRKELEDKRKQLIQDIKKTSGKLEATQKSKAATFERFATLQKQIGKRQQLIRTLRDEIAYTEESIARTNEVIESLTNDIARLKADYASMLRTAYRHRTGNTLVMFLFASDNFNQAFQRWQYIRQYHRYREKQAKLIQETQQMLSDKATQLETRKKEKENLLVSQQSQTLLLDRELHDKDKMLKTLNKDESRLAAELNRQQKAHNRLNESIEAIIREEMARKRKAARTTEALSAGAPEAEDPVSGEFVQRKGRLPWPIKGAVVRSFGVQAHPTLKGIEITNNGIDIKAGGSSEVQAVYAGKVAGTQFIPGYQNLVILQHGNYYTVYSNLEDVFVRRGETVDAAQRIGSLGSKKELHFELWKEKQHLNPVHWLSK